ncbi:MAG: M48 family metallopeptidase [Planctomycetaceae bacterium]|nr:M48 family metallopeptidase [Planctomycetaceae bacterium]
MNRTGLTSLCLIALSLTFLTGCETVPITGRSQLNLVPESMVRSMALQEYNSFLQSPDTKLSGNTQQSAVVQRVGTRIADAVEKYMRENGMEKQIEGYNWEFNLVESKDINAWAMPGGKVVVYTGLMELANTDGQLAAVMGHEIAHAVARHGNERMSQGLLTTMGGVALAAAAKNQPAQTRELLLTSYGIGSSVGVILPYSRKQESEADRLGLIFMAIAGYDPHEALTFWQKMAAKGQGAKVPEFLSTHPADATRIRQIEDDMSEAEGYYKPAGQMP